jgi:hypothetical protein
MPRGPKILPCFASRARSVSPASANDTYVTPVPLTPPLRSGLVTSCTASPGASLKPAPTPRQPRMQQARSGGGKARHCGLRGCGQWPRCRQTDQKLADAPAVALVDHRAVQPSDTNSTGTELNKRTCLPKQSLGAKVQRGKHPHSGCGQREP